MTPTKRNPWKEAAQAKKIAALVDKLRAAHITADLAELLDYQDWVAVAAEAKCKPPSDESKAAVIAHLRAGEGR